MGVKNLFGRGSNEEKLAAIQEYCNSPNPDALLLLSPTTSAFPPTSAAWRCRTKSATSASAKPWASIAASWNWRAEEGEAVRWITEYCTGRSVKVESDGARELVDALGGDMMMISNELEKLILYVGEKKRITLGDVETMVLAAKQRSLYELTDAISAKDRVRALEVLDAILSSGDGEEAAIGHIYMLAKTFRQMLVILERNVRDQRMLWAALWQGFRVPPFAADDIIQANFSPL